MLAAQSRADAELQAARADLADKQAHFTNEHPDVKMAMRRVSMAELALRHAQSGRHDVARMPPAAPAPVPAPGQRGRHAHRRAASARWPPFASRSRPPMAARGHAPNSPRPAGPWWPSTRMDPPQPRGRRGQRTRRRSFRPSSFRPSWRHADAGGRGAGLVVADHPFRPRGPIAGGRFKVALVGRRRFDPAGAAGDGCMLGLSTTTCTPPPISHRVMVDDCFVVVIPSTPRKLPPKIQDGQNNDQARQ